MDCYMAEVKSKTGYSSLKEKYYSQFPAIGGAGNFGINEVAGSEEDDEVMPVNPIKERDTQIASLMASLEECKKEISDASALKEEITKTKAELKSAKKEANLAKKKMGHARKVTEQRMANTLPAPSRSKDEEEALVSLYSSLLDEDEFELDEEDDIAPKKDFLAEVDEDLKKMGSEEGRTRLIELRNKILERVKGKKLERVQRRQSFGSVSSLGSLKRGNTDLMGGDVSRKRVNPSSSSSIHPRTDLPKTGASQLPAPKAKPPSQPKP